MSNNWVLMENIERGVTSMREVETAGELRNRLHEMKYRNREALTAAKQASPMDRFFTSNVFTSLLTGLAVFTLL